MAKRKSGADSPIYQIKVSLKGMLPPIWREFETPGGITLYRLHLILQTVMGWQDYHLYQFYIDGSYYGEPDPEYGPEVKSARTTKLMTVAEAGSQFIYEYDFGDSWQHVLKIVKVLPPDPKIRFARCLAGARACPPEDCGGIWGYSDLLEIIADPTHEEYEEMLEWLGGEFDPEAFDVATVNAALAFMW